jgi:hypothetical protein
VESVFGAIARLALPFALPLAPASAQMKDGKFKLLRE